jgi:hypothetical protein
MNSLMITRITKANADKYRALFADAVYALQTHDESGKPIEETNGKPIIPIVPVTYESVSITAETYEPGFHYVKKDGEWVLTTLVEGFSPEAEYAIAIESGEEITTLEEYFCYIADLRRIDKKFTILPLPGVTDKDGKKDGDEEFFFIDANTRTITVPDAFQKNGISVQGDEIAEMLYFKIDRYFDMNDLGEKKVYIEWTLPADPVTGERKSGASVPDIINTEVAPGYVIVGWPIRSELTQIPGKIDFAVRFYDIHDEGTYANRVVYSFSTIAASVEVKPSLNLNIEKIALDGSALNSEDLIGSRLENSTSKDDVTPDPVLPVWLPHIFSKINGDPLPQEPELIEDDGNALYDTYAIYLTDKVTGEEFDGLFTVQATISDSGRLSYNWIKRDEDGEVILDYNGSNGSAFVEVKDYTVTKTDRKYYYLDEDKNDYVEFNFTEAIPDLAAAKLANMTIYERVATIIMNSVVDEPNKIPVLGSYQARAINRLGRKTARNFSPIALIEGPSEPVITEDLGEKGIFNEGKVDLELNANIDPHAYVTYQLLRSDTKDGEYTAFGEVSTSNKFVITGTAYSEENPDADLGDGYYRATVATKLNSVTTSVTGDPIRITHKPSKVSIAMSEPTYTVGGINRYDVNKPLSVAITFHPSEEGKRTEEDKVEYQWFRYKAPTSAQQTIDLNKALLGEYETSNLDIPISGATTETVQLVNTDNDEGDFYYCRVTNIYNGEKAIKCSSFFDVLDTKYTE